MSPRPGGEADKFGNRYEGRWTVRQLLYVLLGWAYSVTVEEAGPIGEGVEFTLRRNNIVQVHQVKRQLGNASEWSLRALERAGLLRAAHKHAAEGREFYFISITPAPKLNELSDRARRSSSVQILLNHMLTNKELLSEFEYLSKDTVFGSAESAWKTLQYMHVQWPDERDIRNVNNAFAGLLIDGASPQSAVASLGELIDDNLNVLLDAGTIERLLSNYGLRRKKIIGSPTLVEDVRAVSERWKQSVEYLLLQPVITRHETTDVWDRLRGDSRTLFVIGAAGGGKSAVLHATVQQAESAGWSVLALRLDRLEPFTSPVGLGKQLDLSISPVSALAGVSLDTPCLLVIDQLDAVSLASGRMPTSFDVVANLLREASGFPDIRVLLACRKFDLDNDERIRALAKTDGVSQVEVGPLSDEQVDAAVQAMGLDATELTRGQRNLLRSPFNLVLLRSIADQGNALTFRTSRDLLDAYWDRKLRDCCRGRSPVPRFNEVIKVIVNAMSERQQLYAPITVLDQDDLANDARILASEHVLVCYERKYTFFHEEFFDYAFARGWVNQRQTLVEFLLGGEQELFRRGQVRQVLSHLHDDEPERFIQEAEELLLNTEIRFHIKDVVLAVLRALNAPTDAEWAMVERVIETEPDFVERLWLILRTVPWFDRLDAEGKIAHWLNVNEARQNRAMEVIIGSIKERTDRIVELISPHASRSSNYPIWLRWVVQLADLHTSRSLVNLVIDAMRRGEYAGHEHNLWMSAYNLADYEPIWAIDLLSAYLQDQPGAFNLDSAGQVTLLQSTEHAAVQLATKAAEKAPQVFCNLLLPYLQRVMQLTEYEGERCPLPDRQFAYHVSVNGQNTLGDLGDGLLSGAKNALRKGVVEDHNAAKPFLDSLAVDHHQTAQWLLYEGLSEAGHHYAQWAAELLLEGDYRLVDNLEATGKLLATIGPHLRSETFARLEGAILALRVPWESPPKGRCMFTLLAALPESRLSELAQRRLSELRRAFNAERPPVRPTLRGGAMGPPISPESAQKMTDDNWLQAIVKYDTDRSNWTTMRGGAHQLSSVLQSATVADPDRFARFAMRLTPDHNPAYARAILMGLGNAEGSGLPDAKFDAIRHIGSLGHGENDQWLAWPLRNDLESSIPDDIIDLLIDRALHSTSPVEDDWQQSNVYSRNVVERIVSCGINSGRGACAQFLGDVLVHDIDGHRTSRVVPWLDSFARDSSVPVRSCVAHLVAACLRHAPASAIGAFSSLVQADDRLLATTHVTDLVLYIGHTDPAIVEPVIRRMLASNFVEVRKAGGELAAFAGLEWGFIDLFEAARTTEDDATRAGVAFVCAHRLPHTSNNTLAGTTLQQLVEDPSEEVRKNAAEVAGALRGKKLRSFNGVLGSLIGSPSFTVAIDQLLITLEQATDRIDGLVIACAERFIDVFGVDMGNLSTSAAGNADEVARLVLRAYAQARTKPDRAAVLDLIDGLLLFGAYGVDKLVESVERGS